jgi:hypothetical protein
MVWPILVADALMRAGITDVHVGPVSSLDCECPVVVGDAAAKRTDRMEDGSERGEAAVRVTCVRETSNEAEDACYACERAVRARGFSEADGDATMRVAALDTTWPVSQGRDASGRWVWSFDVVLTVVRAS